MLQTADEELKRRLTYQPLGKYWAFPLARHMARMLCPTRVRPNHLTWGAAALMLVAAGLIAAAPAGWPARVSTSIALSMALVLDTADGRLARLQGTSSAFGRWLDQVLDELADVAIHAAVAWAAFRQAGQPIWLMLGIIYASGKYLFLVQSMLGEELETASNTFVSEAPGALANTGRGVAGVLAEVVRLIGHADLRWHLWIALAVLGRLEVALAAYAIYFPARALAGSIRKGVRYA
jgi:phosphatidylglycerophosphate synthase